MHIGNYFWLNLDINYRKIELDWRFLPVRDSPAILRNINGSSNHSLTPTLEFFDPPHYCLLVRLVLGPPLLDITICVNRRFRARNFDDHRCRTILLVINRFQLQIKIEFEWPWLLVIPQNPKRQIHVLRNPISHQIKRRIGWDESDSSFLIKLTQFHTSIKLQIVNIYALFNHPLFVPLQNKLIVHSKFTLRHASELCLDLHPPSNVRLQDIPYNLLKKIMARLKITIGTKLHIDILYDIDIDLILTIPDAFRPPVISPSDHSSLLFQFVKFWQILQLQTTFQYKLLQGLWLCELGYPKVHDFVHKFVDENKIFLNYVLVWLIPKICF